MKEWQVECVHDILCAGKIFLKKSGLGMCAQDLFTFILVCVLFCFSRILKIHEMQNYIYYKSIVYEQSFFLVGMCIVNSRFVI